MAFKCPIYIIILLNYLDYSSHLAVSNPFIRPFLGHHSWLSRLQFRHLLLMVIRALGSCWKTYGICFGDNKDMWRKCTYWKWFMQLTLRHKSKLEMSCCNFEITWQGTWLIVLVMIKLLKSRLCGGKIGCGYRPLSFWKSVERGKGRR